MSFEFSSFSIWILFLISSTSDSACFYLMFTFSGVLEAATDFGFASDFASSSSSDSGYSSTYLIKNSIFLLLVFTNAHLYLSPLFGSSPSSFKASSTCDLSSSSASSLGRLIKFDILLTTVSTKSTPLSISNYYGIGLLFSCKRNLLHCLIIGDGHALLLLDLFGFFGAFWSLKPWIHR